MATEAESGNGTALTWLEFAREAAARFGRHTGRHRPSTTGEIWHPAIRPARSALSSVRGWIMPSLAEALGVYASVRSVEEEELQTCVSP